MQPEKPRIDFDLPGFLKVVESKGAERAAWESLKDLLMVTYRALRRAK